LRGIIDRVHAKYPDALVILAGMQIPANLGPDYRVPSAKFFRLAKKNHLALIPFLLDGVGGHPDLNQLDGIHPTVAGQALVAETSGRFYIPSSEASTFLHPLFLY
jgi:acyl-CoA thioesterase I